MGDNGTAREIGAASCDASRRYGGNHTLTAEQLRQRLDNLAQSLPHLSASDAFAARGRIARINEELRRPGK
jgi:hypothetical protein